MFEVKTAGWILIKYIVKIMSLKTIADSWFVSFLHYTKRTWQTLDVAPSTSWNAVTVGTRFVLMCSQMLFTASRNFQNASGQGIHM